MTDQLLHGPSSFVATAPDAPTPQRAQDAFVTMLREQVAPTLRTWGFRGSGHTFELRDEKMWTVVGFPRSRYSRADEVEFTITVAAVGKDAWEARRQEVPKLGKRPAPTDTVHAGALRLDQVADGRADVWWTVRPDSATDQVARDVLDAVADDVLPWLANRLGRADAARPPTAGPTDATEGADAAAAGALDTEQLLV